MAWLQLALVVPRERAPLVEAALENGGALAVTIDDADPGPLPEPVLEPDPGTVSLWRQVRITALFADDPKGTMLAEQAAAALGPLSLGPPSLTPLDERPWERVWLEDLAPMRFGRRLWVCPEGQRPSAADADAVFVDLDPGLAFGTGHHPTTALCLRWLGGLDLQGRTVVDFGCGSGILAIAALRLGAARAFAVDHDPQALDATTDNALANGVAERLTVAHADDPLQPLAADVTVANILAGPLVELAPQLTASVAETGLIGLSGILGHQVGRVAEAYADFLLEPAELDGDWALLTGRRLATR
ncbi:MAG: 50S ribosomal protein L11 methyltransferase [Thiohalocapsa sp.]|jgi:ribosomal protein L11 methyltransferase